ncbi:MAG TPA: hypothetical protein VFQ22_10560 [Longimicrobiales bacterium]|nr:hypothetical protein [Longimicrobiales bacterium]
MKIPAAVRERAVEALRCEADECHVPRLDGDPMYITEDDDTVDENLVNAVMNAVWSVLGFGGDIDTEILEAAALLEDGWSPGDPVHRIH